MKETELNELEKQRIDTYTKLGIKPVDPKILEGLPEDARRGILEFEAHKVNSILMSQIIGQMKEIAVLPSEIPPANDRNALIKVEFPDEGGVLTYMEGYGLPYRGFPYFELVEKVDVMKKIAKAALSGLYHSLKRRRLTLLLLIPAMLVFRDILIAAIYTFYRLVERFKIRPICLARSMRELHRSFTIERPGEDSRITELRFMLRDLACNILEFDNAYRFRAQDLGDVLDQEALRKQPIKELLRVCRVAQRREQTQEIKDSWKLVIMFISFYLRFDRKLLNMFVDVLSNINKEQFKLTPEDTQFCVKRKDYIFGFMQ